MSQVTSAQAVKELREVTGLGMMECKKILAEAGNDLAKAKEMAAKRGKERAQKVAGKVASEGIIGFYIHHDKKIGVMVELNCNTDFVARGEAFQELAKELAMHVAARSPQVIRREDLDQEIVAGLRNHYASEVPANKPQQMIDKIVDGKMSSWYEERVLLDQQWVKDTSKTIRQLIEDKIATIQENITINRFVRFRVGEAPTFSSVETPAAS